MKLLYLVALLSLSLLFTGPFVVPYFTFTYHNANSLSLDNSLTGYSFTINKNSASLSRIFYNEGNVTSTFLPTPLWSVELRDLTSGSHVTVDERSTDYAVSRSLVSSQTGKMLIITWNNSSAPVKKVILSISLKENSTFSDWKIQVDASGSSYSVFKVNFPRVSLHDIGGSASDDYAVVPTAKIMGERRKSPQLNSVSVFGDYPGGAMSMQFYTFYDEQSNTGLYFATHDKDQYLKTLSLENQTSLQATTFSASHFSTSSLTSPRYTSPYAVTIGPYTGDWYDAAHIYKSWIITSNVSWLPESLLIDNPHIPSVFKNNSLFLVFVNKGVANLSTDIRTALLQTYKETYNLTAPYVIWFDWSGTEPGKFYPPKAGFTEELKNAHDLDAKVILWMSSNFWSLEQTYESDTYGHVDADNASLYAYINESLEPNIFVFGYVMYPNTTFFKDITTEYTFNDVWVDHAPYDGRHFDFYALTYPDFSPSRGHGGGGSFYQDGRAFLQEVRERIRISEPEYITDTEATSEVFIGAVDITAVQLCRGTTGGLGNDGRGGRIVPLFPAVYHEYHMVGASDPWYASYTDFVIGAHRLGPRARMLSDILQSIGFLSGNMLTRVDEVKGFNTTFFNGNYSLQNAYLSTLLYQNQFLAPYLRFGELLHPLNVTVQRFTSDDDGSGINGDLYTIIDSPLIKCVSLSHEIPYVFNAAWKSLENGTLSFLFANWNDRNETITYFVDMERYGLQSGKEYGFYSYLNGRLTHLFWFSDDFSRTETIDARSLASYVIMAR